MTTNVSQYTLAQLAGMIDHTILKPEATETQLRRLCAEALENAFASVCVNSTWVPLCAELLQGSQVKVCTVTGFPLGASLSEVKAYETERSIASGATEVDMVINIGALKSGQRDFVTEDIGWVVKAGHMHSAIVKVIIETCYLSEDEKVAAIEATVMAGADFVKTSTGFGPAGATIADIELMRRIGGPEIGIKAAGGIRTAADFLAMISAGATRIGTSGGVGIMKELAAQRETTSAGAKGKP